MEPFVGQIALLPYGFAPSGWALCQGQLMPIVQNMALFSLLGVRFGGNGTSNFALPDLRGRVPNGQGQGLQGQTIGDIGGKEAVTLTVNTTPAHFHGFNAVTASATTNAPAAALPADGHGGGRGGAFAINRYAASGTATTLAPGAVAQAPGSGQAHNNMQPFLALEWCIALQGVFPSRN